MFGLTDTELQVPAILHKENVARGEARAQSLHSSSADPFAPDGLLTGLNHVDESVRRAAARLMRSVARRSHSAPSNSVWRLRLMADVLCQGKIKDSVR